MLVIDTSVLVDVLRGHPPAVAWMREHEADQFVVPGFVVLELMAGVQDRRSATRVGREIAQHFVRWPTRSALDRGLRLYPDLRLRHGVGILDLLIGVTAWEMGEPIWTKNERHFDPIPDLQVMIPPW
jgi:predicted nucleic acid-binding protein